ncbi:hypothetical protein HJFPF1_06193 [Paramyrothecium foliicola]|nr:hypothetical protein HJFPF1_06193 [Paramyrothecium foliicola]
MPSQRPYFLSSFIAAFRQQQSHPLQNSQQPNKQASTSTTSAGTSSYSQTTAASAPRAIASNSSASASASSSSAAHSGRSQSTGVAIHSPRGSTGSSHGVPIPAGSPGRRRGSDSSSEGFRDVLGADKWYIGGKTATGEEKFFKLGVVRRVRSNDGLSLDRLSL